MVQEMKINVSYFNMRHLFSFPGPLTTMMSRPNPITQQINTGYYRVSAEAIHNDKYVLVGSYGQKTVEGVWEQTWNKNIKSHLSFGAANFSPQELAMMQSPPVLPTLAGYMEFRYPNWATRLRVDTQANELSLSFNRSITDAVMVGAKLATSYDQRRTILEFATKYEWSLNSNANTSNTNINTSSNISNLNIDANTTNINTNIDSHKHCIEASFCKDIPTMQVFYTHGINENIALTSRAMWNGNPNAPTKYLCSFGYKYAFGRMPNAATQIAGEICSNGTLRQIFKVPCLSNMLLSFYGEMNHFTPPELGDIPHKFGCQLMAHF